MTAPSAPAACRRSIDADLRRSKSPGIGAVPSGTRGCRRSPGGAGEAPNPGSASPISTRGGSGHPSRERPARRIQLPVWTGCCQRTVRGPLGARNGTVTGGLSPTPPHRVWTTWTRTVSRPSASCPPFRRGRHCRSRARADWRTNCSRPARGPRWPRYAISPSRGPLTTTSRSGRTDRSGRHRVAINRMQRYRIGRRWCSATAAAGSSERSIRPTTSAGSSPHAWAGSSCRSTTASHPSTRSRRLSTTRTARSRGPTHTPARWAAAGRWRSPARRRAAG